MTQASSSKSPTLDAYVSSDGRTRVLGAVCLLAFGFSTILSGYGIGLSLGELPIPLPVRIIFACTATALLTGLAFLCWRQVGVILTQLRVPRGRIEKVFILIAAFIIGGLATSGSVFTSFTASVFIMQGEAVQSELRARQTAVVAGPIASFSQAQLRVAELGERVRIAAKEASERERVYGNTCGPTPRGDGPITRLRALHSEQAKTHSEAASEMATDSASLLNRLRDVSAQIEVDSIYRSAQELLFDLRSSDLRQWSETTSAHLRGNPVFFEERMHVCTDVQMAEMLDQLTLAANDYPALPDFAPQIREGNVFDSMIVMSDRLARITTGDAQNADDWSILPYAIFSLLIDSIGVVSAIIFARRLTDRLTPRMRADFVRTTWAIRHLVWPFEDGETYLLVPVGGDPGKEILARNLVAKLRLSPRPYRFRVPMSVLAKDVPDLPLYFSSMTGKPILVDIFIIDKKAERRMHELHDEAVLALECDTSEFADYPNHFNDQGEFSHPYVVSG